MTNKKIIARAIEAAGGMRALARELGINHQAIQSWKRIPAERVVAIEAITGKSRANSCGPISIATARKNNSPPVDIY